MQHLFRSTDDQQQSVNNFNKAFYHFCLTENVQSTKVLAPPVPETSLSVFSISICETHLEKIDQFSYLESILSFNCTAEKEVDHRIDLNCKYNIRLNS